MKGRAPVLLVLVLLASCDTPPVVAPVHGGPDAASDGEAQADASGIILITVSPPVGYFEGGDTLRFTATVVMDGDTLDVSPSWSVLDESVATVDTEGLVTALSVGRTILFASWATGLSVGVALGGIVVDDTLPIEVSLRSNTRNQGAGGVYPLVANRPIFVRSILTADRQNDWEPSAVVEFGKWPWGPGHPDTLPMTPPVGGIPMTTAWDDWKHLDSSFHAVIPGDSVKPDPGHFTLHWDWNTDDHDGPWSLGGDVVDPPPFHLVIVPVLWDSPSADRILEWTKDLTADSSRIAGIQDMLPVQAGYPVTVLEPHTTEQDLTTSTGWSTLLSEINAIRIADGRKAYYYGTFILNGGRYVGMAWVGSPVSIGALFSTVITHEIGHNMGLLHAPCGHVGSTDPQYPEAGGLIDHGGYSFATRTLKDPAEQYDVMSYCHPQWISGYHFKKALDYRMDRESLWWNPDADMEPPRSSPIRCCRTGRTRTSDGSGVSSRSGRGRSDTSSGQ